MNAGRREGQSGGAVWQARTAWAASTRQGVFARAYDASMVGIRAGPLVMATMAVILLLYTVLFAAQARLGLAVLTLLGAAACATYVVTVFRGAAAERRARERAREDAFRETIDRRRR